MRILIRHLAPTLGSLVLVAYACNVQPGGPGLPASERAEPALAPEPASPRPVPVTRAEPERVAPQVIAPAPRRAPEPPAGPMATEAAPLPKVDQRIAIFHSSNVEGELDPCG